MVTASLISGEAVKYLLLTAVAVGVVYVGRKQWKEMQKNKIEESTFEQKDIHQDTGMNPSGYAVALQAELNRLNVDEDKVFELLQSIPNRKFMQAVATQYRKAYNKGLHDDLKNMGVIDNDDYNKAMSIINGKRDLQGIFNVEKTWKPKKKKMKYRIQMQTLA